MCAVVPLYLPHTPHLLPSIFLAAEHAQVVGLVSSLLESLQGPQIHSRVPKTEVPPQPGGQGLRERKGGAQLGCCGITATAAPVSP